MSRGQRRLFIGLVVISAVIFVVWLTGDCKRRPAPATQPAGPEELLPATTAAPAPEATPATATAPVETQPGGAAELPRLDRTANDAEKARARTMKEQGMALASAGKLVEARGVLSDALNAAALPDEDAAAVRAKLTEIANATLFSSRVYPDDPCTFSYTLETGDVLVRLERDKFRLHVPEKLLEKINGIPDATKLRAGQTIKLVRGPFHAAITQSKFRMDVFLEEPATGRMIFVRRLRVGTGSNGSTPPGEWRVSPGRKMVRAPWTPPASSDLPQRAILWGQPDYPLGKMGYWISLEGIGDNPHTAEDGYGIHGTNDPSSIGQASSMGCIRLADDDIDLVYSLLYPVWSRVSVQP